MKQLLHFGAPLIAAGFAAWGLNVMDRLFLRQYSSYSELGIYSVTMSVAAVVTIFSGIFNTIWSPMVYKWIATGQYDDQKMKLVLKYLVMFIYFFTILVGLFAWVVTYFLPENYNTIQYLLPMCLLAPMFYTLSEVTGIGIAISKKTKFSMLCAVVAMLCSAVLNYFLVPSFGAAGAALSTAVAFYVFFILRTGISAVIWKKIPYLNILMITMSLLIASGLHLFSSSWSYEIYYVWGVMFFFGILLFKNILKDIFLKVKKREFI